MNVLLVSGIWPPDVGGPASHAPELAAWLVARGHRVEALTTASAAPADPASFRVRWVPRKLPPGVRHVAVALAVARLARRADVVYATSMVGRSAVGTLLARRPLVAKVTSDPAFERARRRGLVGGVTADFQQGGGGAGATLLRLVRDWSVRRAAHVVCPSSYIAGLVAAWRGGPAGVTVLPNPAPDPAEAAPVEPSLGRPLAVFAGRLTAAKNVDAALRAVDAIPGAHLLVVGDGEERGRLEAAAGPRARFLGARPREEVLGHLAAADVAVLPSAWENFPHAAVEALAVGTPVVATRVGGVPEVVRDGENGLLVEPGDDEGLRSALECVMTDAGLRARLAASAAPSVAHLSVARVYGELERILAEAAR